MTTDLGGPRYVPSAVRVPGCKACELHKTARTVCVWGEGNTSSPLMLVGLGPGESEDRFGRPFVGDAGEALNDMLSDAGIRREDIYLTNAVKCWPPGNNPSPHHIIVCSELYLREEIKTVHPQVIVALGNVAARAVVGSILYDGVINHYAGKNRPVMGMNNTWTFITYHPSAWLRSGQRDDLWNLIVGDLKVAYEAAWALEDKYAEQV